MDIKNVIKLLNRRAFSFAYFGKSVLNAGKFYCKSLAVKMNARNLSQKTEISYDQAIQVLNELHPMTEVDFPTQCQREKRIDYDVSIIVPVYNAEKYLRACIMSLLEQKTAFSYEVICVNDGSTDSSLKMLHALCDGFRNVVILNQVNQGLSSARNAGMKIARGKYLFFIDSDDLLPDNAIELLVKTAVETGADIVQGSVVKCNTNGEVYYVNKCKPGATCDLLEYYNRNMSGTAWGKLYKRELWDTVDFFDGYAYEDAIIWCDIYPECRKMAFLSDVVYIFRSQANSLFKRQNNSAKCLDAIWIIKQCIQLSHRMQIQEPAEWYQMMLWQLSVGIVTRIRYFSDDEVIQAAFILARQMAKELQLYSRIEFKGKNRKIYQEIENSFSTLQYKKWVAYSDILSATGSI